MTTRKRPGVDLDAWCRQIQALDDLAKFVESHGPASSAPLTLLNWTVGSGRNLGADLNNAYDAEPVEVLTRYATVLGAQVQERDMRDRVIYFVRGWIGKKEGTKQQPRTALLIRATVFQPLEDQETDR